MKLLEQLQWRYAAKRMNGSEVSDDKLQKVLEAIRLAPSSMGLQPFQVIVIDDEKIREDIFQNACGQPQILECSHLLIFCGWNSVSKPQVDNYMNSIAQTRQIDVELLDDFKESILKFTGSLSPAETREWSARQVYLALGTAIDASALSHIDTTPMEGFNAAALDEMLGLPDRDLHSVVLLALGYRDEHKDEFANTPKVRRKFEDLFEFI
ncbi:NAD(P)H-dependent oxidoreductase [Membranicola marinus]|uniref:NAD(P)H-dependent oxidoreductase n=1 Tax=Membranihabitans marinus TaxID=1227546 RepID=A0A953LA47_9BACT|nr:NAD(P)H-dependent oxidoreductase [Membranihabitans marinus]MBY5958318.1 NAD(P)H-dependent oxidoreductase [Membranihabitans marinus]